MIKKLVVSLAIVLSPAFSVSVKAEENLSEVQFIAQEIHINEAGGFFKKTWHEMDTPEATAAVTAVCTAFNCRAVVPLIVAGIQHTQPSVGNDYKTTGRVDKHVGEEWLIAFPAPAGYVTCSASYDPKTISSNQGETTTGTLFRNPGTGENWIGSYNEVPIHRPEGHWVIVQFVVKYVKAETEDRHQCMPNGTRVWSVNLAK